MILQLRTPIINHLKNSIGWRTFRKVVVISVDDYGNVRLASKAARIGMDNAGLKVHSRFDAFDALENSEDLEMLFDVLRSVKDKHNRSAIFTPFALPCNINFEEMEANGNTHYISEQLPNTYKKLSLLDNAAYKNTWELWKYGISEGLLVPQFHGREHLNLMVFEAKLMKRDIEVLTALKHRSYTSIRSSGYDTISTTAAFEFDKFEENKKFDNVILDGLDSFEQVFGYRAVHFNSPGGREHPIIHKALLRGGINYIDTPWIKREHQGNGMYKRILNYTGKKNHLGQTYIVRNVVFEPTDDRGFDWVNYTLKQIETAFFWHRPAIISSHRVNFAGHIDPKNRQKGLRDLKILLSRIVKLWPDVEFMSADQLGDLIATERIS